MPDDGSLPETITAIDLERQAAQRTARRKRLFAILAGVLAVLGALYLAYWLLVGSRHVSTEDAYVQADTAQVTALVAGAIVSAPVGDTQTVRKGQVVAVIEPADYQLALARAQAELGQAQRRVRGYFASDAALFAQTGARVADIAAAQAQVAAARSNLARARTEYDRRQRLAGTGAVSGDELTAAENQFRGAQAAMAGAQAGLAQARANVAAATQQQKAANVLVAGSDVAGNPEVAAARARLAQAQLDLRRTVVRAPVDGVVARNAIEIGQRVPSGAQLMSVVPIHTAYVDANFKEVQLKRVRIGQPVQLKSDLYGGGVKFHGRVVGLAGGTGSAFAIIPAQNATGNWIKVVQRIPVRISLDPAELARHPLRVGLSMHADIDVGAH